MLLLVIQQLLPLMAMTLQLPNVIPPSFPNEQISKMLKKRVSQLNGQQYEVSDIMCSDGDNRGRGQKLEAKLKKPENFRGYPYFADDRRVQPATDPDCQIRSDQSDSEGRTYFLAVKNLQKCGVGKQNGFTSVRIWFPTLPGLVLMTDQEVLIMCRGAQSTVTENRAAGIAGSIPMQGRISGIVEEAASRPDYGVSVYREATARSGNYVMPVDQAVPIGTRLQLKASVNTNSVWKYAKLVEVTVSTDPNHAYQPGFIFLVQEGCRNQEYQTVVPFQPLRAPEMTGEVALEFEAFLLETMAPTDVLWIHTKIKACVKSHDCAPSRCMDIAQPLGFGRKRRALVDNTTVLESLEPDEEIVSLKEKGEKKLTNFSQNIGIKIIPTGEFTGFEHPDQLVHCNFLLVITIVLGTILLTALITIMILACRVHALLKGERKINDLGGVASSEWEYTHRQPSRCRSST